jgi:DNA-binding XRE family transcriptional regulator
MKDILGYEGIYQISQNGKVFSIKRNKFLKPFINTSEYYQIELRKGGKRKKFYIHRLMLMTYFSDFNYKKEVNHKNGIKTDNRLDNLELVTRKENINHAIKMGLITNKHNVFRRKLTFEVAEHIRKLYNEKKFNQKQLAEQYKVSRTTIKEIIQNITYKKAG